MCELPNGRIEYASRISREGAMEILLSIEAMPLGRMTRIGNAIFTYYTPLTQHQRDGVRGTLNDLADRIRASIGDQ